MWTNKLLGRRRISTAVLGTVTAWLSVLALHQEAQAIPVFARKYATSCTTCHAGFPKLNAEGEAFRRNGYQFPREDLDKVKDEPIPLGTEAWEEMWPDAIWPSDISHLPPVALRARWGFNSFLGDSDEPDPDFRFPQDYSLLSAGTLGKNISYYAGFVLAGKGAHGGGAGGHGAGEEEGFTSEVERLFMTFNNLFAWSDEDDEDGMRLASRWLALPPYALNLRVGQFEPQVIAPWASIHRQYGIVGRLPNLATFGGNMANFEPALRGFEFYGTICQNNSYAIGLVNGSGAHGGVWDNNNQKDFYFRVARKWWGYPMDGYVSEVGGDEEAPEVVPEVQVGRLGTRHRGRQMAERSRERTMIRHTSAEVTRAQSPDEDEGGVPPGLEFWRDDSFETGFFGYFGRNNAMMVADEHAEPEPEHAEPEPEHGEEMVIPDRFDRIGFDARWQRGDLDVYGAWIWGNDRNPGIGSGERMFTWFAEADYFFKPWVVGHVRYEEQHFEDRFVDDEIARFVPGVTLYIRTNLRLTGEFVVDTSANDTTADTFQMMLDMAY